MPRKKIHGNSKYKRKYAKELMGYIDKEGHEVPGMRYNGMSVVEICQKWKINKATYYSWIETYPEFKEAHEHGQVDNASYWQKLARMGASGQVKVNSGMMQFVLQNVDPENWKPESNNDEAKQIQKIEIEILQNKPALEQIDKNVLEAEYTVYDNAKNITDSESS